jgi:flagellar basal body-associated protein FliL
MMTAITIIIIIIIIIIITIIIIIKLFLYVLNSIANGQLQSQHECKQQQYNNTGQNEQETTKTIKN